MAERFSPRSCLSKLSFGEADETDRLLLVDYWVHSNLYNQLAEAAIGPRMRRRALVDTHNFLPLHSSETGCDVMQLPCGTAKPQTHVHTYMTLRI